MSQVNIAPAWEFVRQLFIEIWGIFTNKFLVYGNMSFSIFDLFVGFLFLGIILRLVYTRMHLATAVSNGRAYGRQHDRFVQKQKEEREKEARKKGG